MDIPKIVVLTGASGGIGQVCLEAFVRRGCRVIAVDMNIETLERLVWEKGWEESVEVVRTDLRRESDIDDLVRVIGETWDHVDVLVNNAGIVKRTPTDTTSLEEWNEVLAVNLTGTFLITKALHPLLQRSKQGRIVNLSSRAAGRPHLNASPAYGATKAALIYLTRHWAAEWARDGIRCFAIAPGPVRTPMFDTLDPLQRDKTLQDLPLGRLIEPEEVASLVLYAALDCPEVMTGQTFHCNGATYWT
ncbi:MAG: SDR family oxidoreductase [Spirochaetes bacterium]|nr:SDR family oxidoreductase [Spirochaetota bacterium]